METTGTGINSQQIAIGVPKSASRQGHRNAPQLWERIETTSILIVVLLAAITTSQSPLLLLSYVIPWQKCRYSSNYTRTPTAQTPLLLLFMFPWSAGKGETLTSMPVNTEHPTLVVQNCV